MLPTTDEIKNQLIPRLKNYVDKKAVGGVNDVSISSGSASVSGGTLFIELPDDSEENITREQIAAIISKNS